MKPQGGNVAINNTGDIVDVRSLCCEQVRYGSLTFCGVEVCPAGEHRIKCRIDQSEEHGELCVHEPCDCVDVRCRSKVHVLKLGGDIGIGCAVTSKCVGIYIVAEAGILRCNLRYDVGAICFDGACTVEALLLINSLRFGTVYRMCSALSSSW